MDTLMEMPVSDTIENKIYLLRNQRIMLDSDLAAMYGLETKVLKQSVKRNITRFPPDFMFELTRDEAMAFSRSQNVTLKRGQNIKYLPYAFTEHGVLMLSSILRSERAIQVNIRIVRVYNRLKELLRDNQEIQSKIDLLELRADSNEKDVAAIFTLIRNLSDSNETTAAEKTERIGFRKQW